MGWCSGTDVFDVVCEAMLDPENISIDQDVDITSDTKGALKKIITALEEMDWDCQRESEFWDVPIVHEAFEELHPGWFKKLK